MILTAALNILLFVGLCFREFTLANTVQANHPTVIRVLWFISVLSLYATCIITLILNLTVYIQPWKMEQTQGSETSANYNYNMTPGKYPKEHIQYLILNFMVHRKHFPLILRRIYIIDSKLFNDGSNENVTKAED
jgi:hypothetical protein